MTLARYFLPGSSVSFWHTAIAPVFYDYPQLSDYYIDLTSKTFYRGPFDKSGIPLLDYRGSIGRQYNPCAIAQYGLGWFSCFKRGNEDVKDNFIKMADWLCENIEIDSAGRGWWKYNFDFDAYGLQSPWISALAQGQGISLLLRAAKETGRNDYSAAAQMAFAAMICPKEEGGLLVRRGEEVILEEVLADKVTAILDGMIFAIFGLQDYCFVLKEFAAERLLNECLATLEVLLPKYDLGYWSRADLYHDSPPMVASVFYHKVHIAQLLVLENMTGRSKFGEYARRWEHCLQNPWNKFWVILKKSYFKLRYY